MTGGAEVNGLWAAHRTKTMTCGWLLLVQWCLDGTLGRSTKAWFPWRDLFLYSMAGEAGISEIAEGPV